MYLYVYCVHTYNSVQLCMNLNTYFLPYLLPRKKNPGWITKIQSLRWQADLKGFGIAIIFVVIWKIRSYANSWKSFQVKLNWGYGLKNELKHQKNCNINESGSLELTKILQKILVKTKILQKILQKIWWSKASDKFINS